MDIRQGAIDLAKKYEDFRGYFYLDPDGNVTVAYGHKLGDADAATGLPMKKNGTAASCAAKRDEWTLIHGKEKGHFATWYEQWTTLTIDEPEALTQLKSDLQQAANDLPVRFSELDSYPEKAQDALLDMMFNIGLTKFNATIWPSLFKAVNAKDWNAAAQECHRKPPISEDRNNAIRDLFLGAAAPDGAIPMTFADWPQQFNVPPMLHHVPGLVNAIVSTPRVFPGGVQRIIVRTSGGDGSSLELHLEGHAVALRRTDPDRVAKAKALLAAAAVYPRGCSEFVCAVLGIGWRDANSLMGEEPVSVGTNNVYHNVSPGDILGWKTPGGHGHVGVYVGEPGMALIDVHQDNEKPRSLVNGYGPTEVFRSAEFRT